MLEQGSHSPQKKLATESKDNENISTMNGPTSGTTPMFATSGFTASWNTGPLFSNQSSFSFGRCYIMWYLILLNISKGFHFPSLSGGQSTISVTPDASNDADGGNKI